MIDYAAFTEQNGLSSYLRTWFRIPGTTATVLEDHLLDLLSQNNFSGEYAEYTINTLMLLLEFYEDRRSYRHEIDRLRSRLIGELSIIVDDDLRASYIKALAQRILVELTG